MLCTCFSLFYFPKIQKNRNTNNSNNSKVEWCGIRLGRKFVRAAFYVCARIINEICNAHIKCTYKENISAIHQIIVAMAGMGSRGCGLRCFVLIFICNLSLYSRHICAREIKISFFYLSRAKKKKKNTFFYDVITLNLYFT